MSIKAGLIIHDYEFLEPIGEGGFATVWKVKSYQYDRLFVAKISKVNGHDIERAWKAFDCEVQALMRLDHPNIIKLYKHFRYNSDFVMILEYCPNGSLEEYISKNGPLEGPRLIRVVKNICSALNYCWSNGVQHRDIKPQNIMFDANGRARLVDFGISITRNDEKCHSLSSTEIVDFKCSLVCAAPEIVRKLPYDPVKSDIWATGITILWMARGSKPWNCKDVKDLMNMIIYGQYIIPGTMNHVVEKMTRGMLCLSPMDRVFPSDNDLEQLGCDTVQVYSSLPRRTSGKVAIMARFRVTPPYTNPICKLRPLLSDPPSMNYVHHGSSLAMHHGVVTKKSCHTHLSHATHVARLSPLSKDERPLAAD